MAPTLRTAGKVAVFRALRGLGDMLCSVPALRALRAAAPQAEITLIGLPQMRWMLDRYPGYLDRFLEFPGWPGLPERAVATEEVPRFLTHARAEQFDIAIQLHGNGRLTNGVISLLGARFCVGYVGPSSWSPEHGLFPPYPDGLPEVQRCLELVRHLGAPGSLPSLEFPITQEDEDGLAQIWPEWSMSPPYVCVHPGSNSVERRWRPGYFAEVARGLAAKGLHVVLTGSAAEAGVTRWMAGQMKSRPTNLAGKTDLGQLAALLRGAQLVVSNDTGVSHLADAVGVPSVVVFPSTATGLGADLRRWAPLDRSLHHVFHERGSEMPCIAAEVPHVCREAVEPEEVLNDALDLLLKEETRHVA